MSSPGAPSAVSRFVFGSLKNDHPFIPIDCICGGTHLTITTELKQRVQINERAVVWLVDCVDHVQLAINSIITAGTRTITSDLYLNKAVEESGKRSLKIHPSIHS